MCWLPVRLGFDLDCRGLEMSEVIGLPGYCGCNPQNQQINNFVTPEHGRAHETAICRHSMHIHIQKLIQVTHNAYLLSMRIV